MILFAAVDGLLAAFVFIPAIYPLGSRFIRHAQVEEGAPLGGGQQRLPLNAGIVPAASAQRDRAALLAATAAGAGITKLG